MGVSLGQLPTSAVQTYQVTQLPDRGQRAACEQVGCKFWRWGWEMRVDERTPLGGARASYIRWQSGRTFVERTDVDGATIFRFEPGQRCFAEHFTHPELYLVRGGDATRLGGLIRRHVDPADLIEDMNEHFDAVRADRARG
jgi:hypothetical protein